MLGSLMLSGRDRQARGSALDVRFTPRARGLGGVDEFRVHLDGVVGLALHRHGRRARDGLRRALIRRPGGNNDTVRACFSLTPLAAVRV
jgi:hypothetical protein